MQFTKNWKDIVTMKRKTVWADFELVLISNVVK